MSRHLRPAVLLLSAALIAGCGGGASSSDSSTSPASPGAASASGGQLRFGATDQHLGDATVGGSGGLRVLPNTRVPGTPNTQQGVGAGASCANTDVIPSQDNLSTVVSATLCLLNGERADAGLSSLRKNSDLAEAAIAHSDEMVAKQYFDHVGRDGTDPVARIRSAGFIPSVGTWTIGENLAWGTGSLATPKGIVAAWMKSEGHRENILRPTFKQIGFGVVAGNPRSRNGSGATYTTTFGARSGGATRKASSSKARRARVSRRARAARKVRTARASARSRKAARRAKRRAARRARKQAAAAQPVAPSTQEPSVPAEPAATPAPSQGSGSSKAGSTNPAGSRSETNPAGSRSETNPAGSR